MKSPFNKVSDLQSVIFQFCKKETQKQIFSLEIWKIIKNVCFTERLRATASVYKNHY